MLIKRMAIGATAVAIIIGPAGVWSLQSTSTAAPGDPFTCRASALRVDPTLPAPLDTLPTVEPVVANGPNNPCLPGAAGLNNQALPGNLGTASVLFARTSNASGAQAEAGVADVTITVPGAPVIRAEVLTSRANAGACISGDPTPPALTGSSTIARVTIGTQVIEPVPGVERRIDLGPAGSLTLNQQLRSAEGSGATAPNTITQRAIFLDTPLADVVIAESIADFRGNPCDVDKPPSPSVTPTPTGTASATPTGTASPTPTGTASPTPTGTASPRPTGTASPTPTGTASPTPTRTGSPTPSPTRPPAPPEGPPECSDEIDNDGDGKIDFGTDPGCDSPQDDDERNNDTPECSDGKDNDGDRETDFPRDPGCDSRDDDDERNGPGECQDLRDNDGDGSRDFSSDSGCKSPGDDDEAAGFFTGGGGYDDDDGEDVVKPGRSLRYGTVLPCDLGDRPGPQLTTTFLDRGNEAQFKLTELQRAFCRNDPAIDPEKPDAEFDTFVGRGTGTLRLRGRDVPATIDFVLQDRGEPGAPRPGGIDLYDVVITGGGQTFTGCCTLDEGNNQAHSPNDPAPGARRR